MKKNLVKLKSCCTFASDKQQSIYHKQNLQQNENIKPNFKT